MKRRQNKRAGVTLLDMAIGLGILSTLIGGISTMVSSTRAAYRDTTFAARVGNEARDTVDSIVERLRAAGVATLTPMPDADFGRDRLGFNTMVAAPDGSLGWSAATGFLLELDPAERDDGLDNDGDGLIDERQVVFVPDLDAPQLQRVLLCRDVPELFLGELQNGEDDNGNGLIDEPGLCFSLEDGVLTVRVAIVAALPDGGQLARAAERSLRLKN